MPTNVATYSPGGTRRSGPASGPFPSCRRLCTRERAAAPVPFGDHVLEHPVSSRRSARKNATGTDRDGCALDTVDEMRLHPHATVGDRSYTAASGSGSPRCPARSARCRSSSPTSSGGSRPRSRPGTRCRSSTEAEAVDPAVEARLAEISASVTAPTFDERWRICETVIVSVPRTSASWITRSATWIEYGRVNYVSGVTMRSDSTPATVTSLKSEPGS